MSQTYPSPRFSSFRAIFALILREMTTTYGRSPGGYIWAVVEPVAGIAVFAVVFGYIFDSPPLGSSFALFFATGLLPLMLYQNVAGKVGMAIKFSMPLLAYPRVKYTDTIIARWLLTVLTYILVTVIIVAGLIAFEDIDVSLDFIAIGMALLMAGLLGLGVGLFNSFMLSMFPIYQTVWAVVNRPMFIVSGVLYLIDPLPVFYRDLLLLNPICHVVMKMREGVFVVYDAVYVSTTYVFFFAGAPAVIGLILLHRYHNDILEN